IPFAIAGTLIRIGLGRLETFDGAPVFSLVYAQWIGCFVMGMAAEKKQWLLDISPVLQIGIATGLCGSITTFSSWQLDIFEAFANYDQAPHTTGKNVLGAISVFLVTLAMALNGLVFGRHVARMLYRKIVSRGYSIKYMGRTDWIVLLFGLVAWAGVAVAAGLAPSQRELALACVFGPAGALLRWHWASWNVLSPRFPWGTWVANMVGTLVLAILSLLGSGVAMPWIACQVLQGLADGFCGCLTTISTFMASLTNLRLRHAYFYGVISVVLGQCLMFLVFGTFIWTRDLNSTCAS
ncbi:CrcB-like protein-domain-containing protein, partial [Dichotomocladium elegans]